MEVGAQAAVEAGTRNGRRLPVESFVELSSPGNFGEIALAFPLGGFRDDGAELSAAGQALDVEEFDPRDASEAVIREFHALQSAQSSEARPLDPPTPFEVLAAGVRALPDFVEVAAFLARDHEGVAAGFAYLSHRRTGTNPHIADLQLWADPRFRRRGAAAALLEAVCHRAGERGHSLFRTTTTAGIGWGEDLCRNVGAKPALERRTWRLPLSGINRDEIRSIAAQAADRARGYSLEDIEGELPSDIVDQAVELLSFLGTEPRGELEGESQTLTVDQLRALEKAWAAMGVKRRWLFARHESSGGLAGVVDAVWQPASPKSVISDHTVVRPEYRGRGLALWMKACVIDGVMDQWPEAEDVRTTTTFPNAAMDSVDERIGFVPYVRNAVWQMEVQAIESWLAASAQGRTS